MRLKLLERLSGIAKDDNSRDSAESNAWQYRSMLPSWF